MKPFATILTLLTLLTLTVACGDSSDGGSLSGGGGGTGGGEFTVSLAWDAPAEDERHLGHPWRHVETMRLTADHVARERGVILILV